MGGEAVSFFGVFSVWFGPPFLWGCLGFVGVVAFPPFFCARPPPRAGRHGVHFHLCAAATSPVHSRTQGWFIPPKRRPLGLSPSWGSEKVKPWLCRTQNGRIRFGFHGGQRGGLKIGGGFPCGVSLKPTRGPQQSTHTYTPLTLFMFRTKLMFVAAKGKVERCLGSSDETKKNQAGHEQALFAWRVALVLEANTKPPVRSALQAPHVSGHVGLCCL